MAEKISTSDKYSWICETDLTELKAFIGLMYLRAATNSGRHSTKLVFFHNSSHDVFQATMSRNRFVFLCHALTFDEKASRQDRWQYDKFACFREFFEAVNANNASWRVPSEFLSIDETLYPYRGSIGIRQYNPAKTRDHYGLLYRSVCDATVPYTYYSHAYAGRPEATKRDPAASDPALKYYINTVDDYSKYLITGLHNYQDISGRNISLDRYFTSLSLVRWGLGNNVTIVGTMRKDRQGIPVEMRDANGREPKSVKWCYLLEDPRIMLISYADKKKSGNKIVLVISSMHDSVRVTKDGRRKPSPIVFYDHTKGGVDIVDQHSSYCSTRMKTTRWTMNALAFVLDTVKTNAQTILSESKNPQVLGNMDFAWQLGMALVLPQLQSRLTKPGIQLPILTKVRRCLKIDDRHLPNQQPLMEGKSGRCHVCVAEIVGTPDYKQLRQRLNKDVKTRCVRCGLTICKKHTVLVCGLCEDKQ